jgi:hypothetical protein
LLPLYGRNPTERDVKFENALKTIGLDHLEEDEKIKIRVRLENIHANAVQEEQHGLAEIDQIVASLDGIAERIESIEEFLRGKETGLRKTQNIEVAIQVSQGLVETSATGTSRRLFQTDHCLPPRLEHEVSRLESANNGLEFPAIQIDPEIVSSDDFLADFCDRARVVREACKVRAESLRARPRTKKRPREWFHDFTILILELCKRHQIPTSASNDRITGQPGGALLEMADTFQQLFDPHPEWNLRRDPVALLKRLRRELKRLDK